MRLAVFFLLRIDLAMQALFWFHMKFKVVFSSSVKKGSIFLTLLAIWISLCEVSIQVNFYIFSLNNLSFKSGVPNPQAGGVPVLGLLGTGLHNRM